MVLQGESYATAIPYHPLRAPLRRFFGLDGHDPIDAGRQLRAWMAEHGVANSMEPAKLRLPGIERKDAARIVDADEAAAVRIARDVVVDRIGRKFAPERHVGAASVDGPYAAAVEGIDDGARHARQRDDL